MANITTARSAADLLDSILHEASQMRPLLPMFIHLILSAIFPIYIGSHASLSRPRSASPQPKRSKTALADHDEEEDPDEGSMQMEGLSPRDAILIPVMTGSTLVGLYFLILWLQDAAVLNLILTYYLSVMSLFTVGNLCTDALRVAISFVFPDAWRNGKEIMQVRYRDGNVTVLKDEQVVDALSISPLPRSFLSVPFPKSARWLLWKARALLKLTANIEVSSRSTTWCISNVGLDNVIGLLASISVLLYYTFISKPWFLTNLMGFGFSYVALQILSPTTFWTGTLILLALFCYDIYFVFFTPVMIKVATSLEVPVMLLFPRPGTPKVEVDKKHRPMAMLGLGDIVIPGLLIGLALRFDLYLFYLKKLKNSNVKTAGEHEHQSNEIEKSKPIYRSATGGWGERFWLHPLPYRRKATAFPKRYFHATLLGYVVGLIITIVIMQVFEHGQPALLYLVPGVLGALWITAALKGEMSLMWMFSEEAEEEEDKSAKEKPAASEKRQEEDVEPQKQNGEAQVKPADGDKITSTSSADATGLSEKSSSGSEKGQKRIKTVFCLLPAFLSRASSRPLLEIAISAPVISYARTAAQIENTDDETSVTQIASSKDEKASIKERRHRD